MHPYRIPVWKTVPFFRLLIPLMAGIILLWYWQVELFTIVILISFCGCLFFLFYYLPVFRRYQFRFLHTWLLMGMIMSSAMYITWQNDIRHSRFWFGNHYEEGDRLAIKIAEPPVEKNKSFKATGQVYAIGKKNKSIPVSGKIQLYFSKEQHSPPLEYGDIVMINKPLQRIKNGGNPGSFDFQRYAAFQQVYHQVFLKKGEWSILQQKDAGFFRKFIFALRSNTVHILQKYFGDDKKILGISEALLIGFKEDLDKDLVQAYSNTGVVHIIAISGLHLGLIYLVLSWLFKRAPFVRRSLPAQAVLILSCLWLFALLTGASASVLRSAVMFTCIVAGKTIQRQSSVYNALAVSAFILLCYNPYFLWDVGFQLSYLAIIGILWLQQPIYRLIYVKNLLIDKIWQMASVTLAAQLTAFPICIYYFHQFPNLFFIANLVAVPLSTVILFAEIGLLMLSWFPAAAFYISKATGVAVYLMNTIIEYINQIPYSVMDNIHADGLSTWILYAMLAFICGWLLHKRKLYFWCSLFSTLLFFAFHFAADIQMRSQKKIIVYNIPKQQAIDFVFREEYFFNGDAVLQTDGVLKNFHLKPSRISFQLKKCRQQLPGLSRDRMLWHFFQNRLLLIDSSIAIVPMPHKLAVDVLVISKNAGVRIAELTCAIQPAIIVFDASNSLWKIAKWKKECEALLLPCFSIPEQGAFVYHIK